MNTENTDSTARHYQASADALKDKVIVVTGAGSGIGRAASLAFATHGATVVLLGRTLSKLESVYDEIEKLNGPTPAIFPINFADAVRKDYEDLNAALTTEFGRIDGLLNNAGKLGPRTPIENYSTDEWQSIMQINVTAPFMLTQSLLPLLSKSVSASVIFTSSGVAPKGRAYWGAYAASKAATDNLTQTLADELENTSNIRVNSIDPGATRTAMRSAAYPAEDPVSVTSPEDIMPSYLYLMSDESTRINGQRLKAQS